MSDQPDVDLPPGPPAPLAASAPDRAVEPWQARLEVVALLLLLSVAVLLVTRLASAYDVARQARTFSDDSVDLVSVVRIAGEQTGPGAAIALVLVLVLVTLGPGDGLSARGVLALRSTCVVGLAIAGVTAFAGIAAVIDPTVASFSSPNPTAVRNAVDRVSVGAPLLLAAAAAGYVAWCAFSTLGEVPDLLFSDEGPSGDLGTASEGSWELPPSPLAADDWAPPPTT